MGRIAPHGKGPLLGVLGPTDEILWIFKESYYLITTVFPTLDRIVLTNRLGKGYNIFTSKSDYYILKLVTFSATPTLPLHYLVDATAMTSDRLSMIRKKLLFKPLKLRERCFLSIELQQ